MAYKMRSRSCRGNNGIRSERAVRGNRCVGSWRGDARRSPVHVVKLLRINEKVRLHKRIALRPRRIVRRVGIRQVVQHRRVRDEAVAVDVRSRGRTRERDDVLKVLGN